jgi:protoheme ferro-lyase
MYIRFVVGELDDDSGNATGIFQAIYGLRDAGKLYAYEETILEELRQWFKTHLQIPDRFTASKPPHYRKQNKAISWFKDTAHEQVARIREIVAILENHGIPVRMIKADRVGYVVYEDDIQVVAEPFSDLAC